MSKQNKTENNKESFLKYLENPKHRSYLYTGLFFAALVFFFIMNNLNGEPEVGPYPPNYNVSSTDLVSLSQYKGKVVLIDFWATWCPPCRKGIPDLVKIKEKYKGKDLEIIGISLDGITRGGATKDDVIPFIKDFKINYPILVGDATVIQQYGGIQSIPTSFVIDKEGYIVSYYQGLVQKENYLNDIEKALGKNYTPDKRYIAPEFSLPKVK